MPVIAPDGMQELAKLAGLGCTDTLQWLDVPFGPLNYDWVGPLKNLHHLGCTTTEGFHFPTRTSINTMETRLPHFDLKEPTDTQLMNLPDHVIEKIMSYLTTDDSEMKALKGLNRRLWAIWSRVYYTRDELTVDHKWLANGSFSQLERYKTRQLTVSKLDEQNTLKAISCFPELTALTLCNVVLKGVQNVASFPKTLTHLDLNDCPKMSDDFARALAEHLQPNLQVVKARIRTLRHFIGLKEVRLIEKDLKEDLSEFWRQNPDLEVLEIDEEHLEWNGDYPEVARNFAAIAELTKLRTVRFANPELPFIELPWKNIAHVVILGTAESEFNACPFLERIGRSLKSLEIVDPTQLLDGHLLAQTLVRFCVPLESLTLGSEWFEPNMDKLLRLVNLKRFSWYFDCAATLEWLLIKHPALEDVVCPNLYSHIGRTPSYSKLMQFKTAIRVARETTGRDIRLFY